ncbi:SIR2 family protein [Bradyrhizobium brasilense]|uniref:SIR2 family protein n=1 Tax=Bradyrhizobium brasilense TaxID=1419277 RepID=UPI001457684A|nr:SIR2 family protein [Bradyrhizobium brasilense]NLS75393.1 SIR2 family protein [Bradyrhizobium brasilense]
MDAAQRGKLIPFVGAGASVLAGCPSWGALADGALRACIKAEKFNHGQYEQIRNLLPRMKLSIARAIEAEHKLGIDYAKLVQSDEFTPANLNQPNCVFHLHGSVINPSGMIMTTRDYIRHYANDRRSDDPAQENRTLTFLEFLFQQKTVLFVGYGLDDLEILEYVIQKARQQVSSGGPQARHFMLQGYFAHEYELMRSMALYYAQCDIELIPFRRDQRDWAQLIEVLEAFAVAMPATKPLGLQKQVEMEALLD